MAAAIETGARAGVVRRPAGAGLVLALTCAVVPRLASCEQGGGAAPASNAVAPAAPGARSVLFVSLDTLRADHLGCYGYERETSPAIDALAQRGSLFEEDVSSSSWTVPAHMSMLTGLYPRSHGVDEHGKKLAPQTTTLAEYLSTLGFSTAGIVTRPMLGGHNFSQGFEEYVQIPGRLPDSDEPTLPAGSHATEILAQGRSWLKQHRQDRFLLFLHLFDVHSDYDAEPRFREHFARPYSGPADGTTKGLRAYLLREPGTPEWSPAEAGHLIDLYDAEIRQLDAALSSFLTWFEGSGLAATTLLVLTADHGEEFLEHGEVLHGHTLYPEVLHVPLILAGPGIPRGERFRGQVSPVDLFPTIAQLLGVNAPPGMEGLDLTAAWRERAAWPPARAVFSETRSWPGSVPGDFRGAIRRGPWTLQYDQRSGAKQFFQLDRDPHELRDATADEPELAAEMWKELEAFLAGTRSPLESAPLDDDELAELKALGYR